MNYCKDCRHSWSHPFTVFHCKHKDLQYDDPVKGKQSVFCSTVRFKNPDCKHFEEKEEPKKFIKTKKWWEFWKC